MTFNLALILVVITALTGVITLYDKLFLEKARVRKLGDNFTSRKERKKAMRAVEPVVVEYAKSFFPILLLVLVIRSFLFEPFRIPSSSMVPTLLVGDLILVNKYSYGVRLPVTNTKIIEGDSPQRGDVIVFRFPDKPEINYIKRVIGLPGDTVELRKHVLFVNDNMVTSDLIGVYSDTPDQVGFFRRLESLPDAKPHEYLLKPEPQPSQNFPRTTVPEGHYFVMGDNRDQSSDSRSWGFVPEQNLVGEAVLIWMRLSFSDWDRIGMMIE